MQKSRGRRLLGGSLLVAATVIWGVSFVVLKNTLDLIPPLWIMGIRFLGGAVLLALVNVKKLRHLNGRCLACGALLGAMLFCAYLLQTYGLRYTTPGKNAFLTAAYCVIVPFLGRLFYKNRIDRFNVIAAVVCLAGIGLVSLRRDLSVNLGDALTLGCSVFFAIHIVLLDRFVKRMDIALLIIVQFAVVGAASFLLAPLAGEKPAALTADVLPSLLYICLMCTVVAYLCQSYGQKNTPPSEAALLLSLESVFGVLASIVFYREAMTAQLVAGFTLIFAAVVISETKLSFLRRPLPAERDRAV